MIPSLKLSAFWIVPLLERVRSAIQGDPGEYPSARVTDRKLTLGKILTGSIVLGWSLSVFTLGHWTTLGYTGSVIASKQQHLPVPSPLTLCPATGLYALAFGILGLLPVPKIRNVHD